MTIEELIHLKESEDKVEFKEAKEVITHTMVVQNLNLLKEGGVCLVM